MPSLSFRLALLLGAFLFSAARLASAQLAIEITGAGAQRIPVAIVPFAGEGSLPGGGITPIVRADLERSGLFRALEVPPLTPAPTEASPINYAEWRGGPPRAAPPRAGVPPAAGGRGARRCPLHHPHQDAPPRRR